MKIALPSSQIPSTLVYGIFLFAILLVTMSTESRYDKMMEFLEPSGSQNRNAETIDVDIFDPEHLTQQYEAEKSNQEDPARLNRLNRKRRELETVRASRRNREQQGGTSQPLHDLLLRTLSNQERQLQQEIAALSTDSEKLDEKPENAIIYDARFQNMHKDQMDYWFNGPGVRIHPKDPLLEVEYGAYRAFARQYPEEFNQYLPGILETIKNDPTHYRKDFINFLQRTKNPEPNVEVPRKQAPLQRVAAQPAATPPANGFFSIIKSWWSSK